jgi:hypothetical protein
MSRNDPIIRFVKETLGCKCPDEVFSRIELKLQPEGNADLRARIIVGGRLLIYIAEIESSSSPVSALDKLVLQGIKERDVSGLNRFRLVIASDDPDSTEEALAENFKSLVEDDEKVHLHVIARGNPSLKSLLK